MIRPFTTKWHTPLASGTTLSKNQVVQFRIELLQLQTNLRKYIRLLADMAGVEDLTDLEVD